MQPVSLAIQEEVKKNPGEAIKKAIGQVDRGEFDKALSYLETLLRSNLNLEASLIQQAHYYIGIIFWKRQDYSGTIDHFENYNEHFPIGSYRIDALYHIGMAHRALGEKSLAISQFEQITKEFPTDTYLKKYSQQFLDELMKETGQN